MSQIVVFRLFKNGELVEVKQFATEQVVIGRNEEAQIVILDDKVSPLHAVVENRSGKYFLSDLGSEAGTYQNGNRILELELKSGSEFQVSEYTVQFFIGIPGVNLKKSSNVAADDNFDFGANQAEPIVETDGNKTLSDESSSKNEITEAVAETSIKSEVKEQKTQPVEPPPIEKRAEQTDAKLVVTHEAVGALSDKPHKKDVVVKKEEIKKEESKDGKIPKGSFAPPSHIQDLRSIIKPEKGTVVEVLVAWKERVIQTHHFNEEGTISIGSDPSCEIQVPLLGTRMLKHKFIKIDSLAHVMVTTEMSGEYIEGGKSAKNFAELSRSSRMQRVGEKYVIDLAQGDMVVVTLLGGTITLYVRYVAETPKPLMAPLLDLTASEVTGIILAVVVASIFGLYMMVYAPEKIDDSANLIEEPFRRAIVKFDPPKRKKIVQVGSETKKKEEPVKVVEQKKAPPTVKQAGKTGKTASAKPMPQKKPAPADKVISTRNKGGAIKTGKKGASAKSKQPDPTKMGLLGVFGNRGMQKKLNKAYDGSGGLIGLADQATGKAGFDDSRSGDNFGGKLKATGGSGKGKSSVGVSGPITDGRGSGSFGKYSGGVGKKGSVQINIGGQEESFVGTIDREAIRRVILDNIAEIRHCYERELNRSPDMFGKLVLEWDIVEKGAVRRAKVKSNSLNNSNVANCVKKRLESWRFPEPPDDQVARVTYPFVFASK